MITKNDWFIQQGNIKIATYKTLFWAVEQLYKKGEITKEQYQNCFKRYVKLAGKGLIKNLKTY